jgi:hypothetical protein
MWPTSGGWVMSTLVPIVFGFLLTTVAGGLLGYLLQNRSWRHQYEVQRLERDRHAAVTALTDLARLLDRRRYRMVLLQSRLEKGADHDLVDDAIRGYREVLFEWNDGLNARLAVVEAHFGPDLKTRLEELYEGYRSVGADLDAGVHAYRAGQQPDLSRSRGPLELLNHANYDFCRDAYARVMQDRVRTGPDG